MSAEDQTPDSPGVLDDAALQAIAEATRPRALSADHKAAMRERLFARINAPPPADTQTFRADELGWKTMFPKVDIKVLYRSVEQNTQTALWRLGPGAVIPGHRHSQEEECWVVEGSVLIGDHPLRAGDMHVARIGAEHPDFSSAEGALLLVRSEIRAGA